MEPVDGLTPADNRLIHNVLFRWQGEAAGRQLGPTSALAEPGSYGPRCVFRQAVVECKMFRSPVRPIRVSGTRSPRPYAGPIHSKLLAVG